MQSDMVYKNIAVAVLMLASVNVQGIMQGVDEGEGSRSYRSFSELNSSQQEEIDWFDSVRQGNLNNVKSLIDKNIDVNAKNTDGDTALLISVNQNDIDTAKMLVDHGADIYEGGVFCNAEGEIKKYLDKVDENIQNFMTAAKENNSELIRELSKAGTFVDVRDENSYTALMHAAARGSIETIKFLIAAGADVNVVSNSEDNAIMFAARNGQTDALRALLINEESVKNLLILYKNNVIASGKQIERWSFHHSSLINLCNSLGHTPLISALKNNHEDTAAQLIDFGADVNKTYKAEYIDPYARNKKNIREESPLMIAAEYGHIRVIEKLLEGGANVNFKNEKGTALTFALRSDTETSKEKRDLGAKILINRGIEINDPESMLFLAVKNGYLETAKVLAERVKNIGFKNQNENMLLALALKKGYFEFAEKLITDFNADINAPCIQEEEIGLGYNGGDGSRKTTYTETFLTRAVRDNLPELVKWLVAHKVNTDIKSTVKVRDQYWSSYIEDRESVQEETPLEIAQKENLEEIVDILQNQRL